MHFVWPMTAVALVISLFDNGKVKGNNLEIQVSQMLQEMNDLKQHLEVLQNGLDQEKVIRINLGKKIDSMEETCGKNQADFATTIENVDRRIENRLLFRINATEVKFGTKLEEKVSTIIQTFMVSIGHSEKHTVNKLIARINDTEATFGIKLQEQANSTEHMFKGIVSKLNQTFDNLYEQINQWRFDQQGHTPTKLPYCEVEWEEYQSSCYYFESRNSWSKSWDDARQYCEGKNSKLLRIDDPMEFMFIHAVLMEQLQKQLKEGVTPLSGYWTGGNDAKMEGQWMWLPNIPMRFTVWADWEPNDKDGVEDCGELSRYQDFKMNDLNCWRKKYFICEKLIGT